MLSAALVSLLLGSLPALALPSPRTASVGAANSTISWSLCPDTPNDARNTTFYCSSLQVPLNWLDPKEGVNADLFLRMYPADEGVERKGSLVSSACIRRCSGPGRRVESSSRPRWLFQSHKLLNAGGKFS